MRELRFGVMGAGFWTHYQLAAWKELGGATPVAIYNRTRSRAEVVAAKFDIPRVYDHPEELLTQENLDFVDIITSVESHAPLVRLAARHGIPAICQKPMGTTFEEAQEMVAACQGAGVPLMIHENWRWQHPIRQFSKALNSGAPGVGHPGNPFRARIHYCSSFPVFDNQPFLKELDQFIVTDMGSHILDAARFLFGEAKSVYCITQRIHPDISGEDVATILLDMERATVTCEISYASRTEIERFPETFIFVECEHGSVELAPDFWIRVTTAQGTHAYRVPPPRYAWADPAYDVAHASIVAANADFLEALRTGKAAETEGSDNLNTVRLVFAAYESAQGNKVVTV